MMFFILGWVIYGLIVGYLAKLVHPGEDPVGFLPTIGIGVAGSYVGGFINWVIGAGHSPFSASGILMGTIGGVVCCWAYRNWRLNRFFQAQGRMPNFKQ
jgi:uncharacterized membrane protein YeaQ/YmgE (transglycosylase-associated protein family)